MHNTHQTANNTHHLSFTIIFGTQFGLFLHFPWWRSTWYEWCTANRVWATLVDCDWCFDRNISRWIRSCSRMRWLLMSLFVLFRNLECENSVPTLTSQVLWLCMDSICLNNPCNWLEGIVFLIKELRDHMSAIHLNPRVDTEWHYMWYRPIDFLRAILHKMNRIGKYGRTPHIMQLNQCLSI